MDEGFIKSTGSADTNNEYDEYCIKKQKNRFVIFVHDS